MKRFVHNVIPAAAVAALLVLGGCSRRDSIDLAGSWSVSLDSLGTWQPIALPGTTDLAGLGEANTLEPSINPPQINRLTRRHSFLGAAYYRRTFVLPSSMEGRPLKLKLERVLWQSGVWIDGEKLPGDEESLTTPHYYNIPPLEAGRHEIMVRVDNRKRYDISWQDLAHSYTNDTQVIWNGILGEMSLTAADAVEIASADVFPDYRERTALVRAVLVRHGSGISETGLEISSPGGKTVSAPAVFDRDTVVIERSYALGKGAGLWDEFNPELQTLRLRAGKAVKTVSFGLRNIETRGRDILVNGRRIFLRGTLDCCIFPLTGTPPLDDAGWEKEIRVCKEWGLNHIRFHSWCPPEAAFRVADREGVYLQVELPVWSKRIGEPSMNAFLEAEYERIVRAYGNHPSFCMLACGNELDSGYDFLNALLVRMKTEDPRHIYSVCSYNMGAGHKGYPEKEEQYMVSSRTFRGQIRGESCLGRSEPDFTGDYSAYIGDWPIPIISHEIGQYSVYPHLSEIPKYTGTLIPLNLMGVRDSLERNGLLGKAEEYTMASGRLAALLYREEVERALRTEEMSGFQLLGLQDFSGQSTALVGLVDAFWDNKGLVSPGWFRQSCAPVVPLARFKKACWTSDECFRAGIDVANYWSSDIEGVLDWSLRDGAAVVASGSMDTGILRTGELTHLQDFVTVGLGGFSEARVLTLEAGIRGSEWRNSWNIWVYPSGMEYSEGEVLVTGDFKEAKQALGNGRSVLYAPDPSLLKGETGKFVPVFWSPVFFPSRAGTMGLLCDPSEPALASFPTAMHSDWQWWSLCTYSKALDITALPRDVHSIVEAVDNFTQNRRLSYLFETQCESGRLVVCAMDLLSERAGERPEARQLLHSILEYMNGGDFNPRSRISAESIESFVQSR